MRETYGHTAPAGVSSKRSKHVSEILLFDDSESFATTWAALLRQDGFTVSIECDPLQVRNRVVNRFFDVILLDLVVEKGDYDGLDVLMDIMTYSKRSQVIVVTGSGTTEQVVTCIKRGACGFVSKNSLEGAGGLEILVEQIRVALETPEIRNDPEVQRENLIDSLWSNIGYGEPGKVGRRLEQLLKLLFESLPAFYEVQTNYRARSQEIDLVITHHNTHPLWSSFGGVFLGECKNWRQKGRRPQRKDFVSFWDKLEARGPLGRLGFFISCNGFSPGFMDALRGHNLKDRMVVPLGWENLAILVQLRDGSKREEYFRQRVIEATMG